MILVGVSSSEEAVMVGVIISMMEDAEIGRQQWRMSGGVME